MAAAIDSAAGFRSHRLTLTRLPLLASDQA